MYISRVKIKNFRNFRDVDIQLSPKQLIIGENNTGKTNFIRALQIILDPSLSEEERLLSQDDFSKEIERPLNVSIEATIEVYFSNFEKLSNIMAQLGDALVEEGGNKYLKVSYKCSNFEDNFSKLQQKYIIFKGIDSDKRFTYEDRKIVNLKVIKALRNAETELKSLNKSPIKSLLKEYAISEDDLEILKKELENSSNSVLELEEIKYLKESINQNFKKMIGQNSNHEISLDFFEIDPQKLINNLKIFIDEKYISDISLGINNLLYISLLLSVFSDKTIPKFLSKSNFESFNEDFDIDLNNFYNSTEKGNYILDTTKDCNELYSDFQETLKNTKGITLLAIEEPEAHLHPIYQRLVYKEVIGRSNLQVLLTTHSPHLASIAPLRSIAHFQKENKNKTVIKTTTNIDLSDKDIKDLERYIDIKRGELYFAKGIIFVEGIAEEYLIPKFSENLGYDLDEFGIFICNINSVNFYPYVKFLNLLNIPYVLLTDGDYYYKNETNDRKYGEIHDNSHIKNGYGFLGYERIEELLSKLESEVKIPTGIPEKKKLFIEYNIFISIYTLEIEIMKQAKTNNCTDIICNVFDELTSGGDIQKSNFKKELEKGEFPSCLRKIENSKNGIGKGRFSQRLSSNCVPEIVPEYIKIGIETILSLVKEKFDE